MATYTELFNLRTNDELRNKIAVAVTVKAQALLDGGTPTAAEVAWANEAIENPGGKASSLLHYVLAKNKAANVGAITGASDTAIQTHVDAAVDVLISGGA